ncbi:cytochrome c [Leptospira sp. WS58.C1]|uniref:c-type cytochrome n=1 Tax=Leptospira TaxID=171 RepID=UPI0002BDB545|nr:MULTISPECIES: cytochrome c [unclassified Leptospira]EMJ99863.1 cytochrome C [Leptospira sp. B5-022]MCR1795432.1 cytochrome c [Leptospira sp. id769339]
MKTRAILISLFVSILSLTFLLNCGDKEKPKEEAAPVASAATLSPEIEEGKKLFLENGCNACHGDTGAGDGAAAASLNPKPRNYKAPANEWKNGPTEAGILKTLNNGIPSNPVMTSYKFLGDEKLKKIAKYVIYLNQN